MGHKTLLDEYLKEEMMVAEAKKEKLKKKR